MKHFKVLTIGGATQDITFHTNQGVLVDNKQDITRQKLVGFEYGAKINIAQTEFTFGGGAANTAVAFSRLGARAASLIAIGNDTIGNAILENLKKEKIETKYTLTSQKSSGLSVVVAYGARRQDHILFTFRGANEDLKVEAKNIEEYKPDWIYLSSLSGKKWLGVLTKIFGISNKNNIKVAWNPGNLQISAGLNQLKPYLNKTQVMILNKDEAIELVIKKRKSEAILNPKRLLMELDSWCPGVIVITDGERGAYALSGHKIYFQEVKRIRAKDTTGVGDAFGSTFIWGLNFFKGDAQAALGVASINASAVITQPGAQAGLLTQRELLKVL